MTPAGGGSWARMRAEEESCHSRAHDSLSCGGLLDNGWPVMLAYAEVCYMSPQKICRGSGLCDKHAKNTVWYDGPLKDAVILC